MSFTEETLRLRVKIGVCRGAGMTIEATGEAVGKSVSSIKRHASNPVATEFESFTRQILATVGAGTAEKIASSVKERISRLLARALGASEQLVDTAIESSDFSQLLAAHRVGEWAAKFEISEAPKRMQIQSEAMHTHVHVLTLAEAENILQTRKMIAAQPAGLIAGASDVIDIAADA